MDKITSTRFEDQGGYTVIHGTIAGVEVKLFGYYPDELSFGSSELVGLTEDQAVDVFLKRDVAYIQS